MTRHRARRIRTTIGARSLRAGILLARGLEHPGGWIDEELLDRAYLRHRVRGAAIQLGTLPTRRAGIRDRRS